MIVGTSSVDFLTLESIVCGRQVCLRSVGVSSGHVLWTKNSQNCVWEDGGE